MGITEGGFYKIGVLIRYKKHMGTKEGGCFKIGMIIRYGI